MKKISQTQRVMDDIQQKIAARIYLPHSRLPSVRKQAKALNVSISTVVEAYDQLAAQGIIRAKAGAGFYLNNPPVALDLQQIMPAVEREVDPLWVSRQSLSPSSLLKAGCGWLPPDWLFEEGMRRALRTAARLPLENLTAYADPFGHQGLRQFLAQRLCQLGTPVSSEQIMLTESGTQAIDLIFRLLLNAGDTVLLDEPCYFNFLALAKSHRLNIVSVPYRQDGADIEQLEQILQQYRPKLYITNAGIHNPTGGRLSTITAHKVLSLAKAYNMLIVEDEIFADLEEEPAARLSALDGLEQVIVIGSFSKTISSAMRCGYIACCTEWLDKLVDLKIATGFGTNALSAELLYALLQDKHYRKHLSQLRQRLSLLRQPTLARLQQLGIDVDFISQGLFLWAKLPHHLNSSVVAQRCLAQGVMLAPAQVFSPKNQPSSYVRFNIAQCQDKKIFDVLQQVIQECQYDPTTTLRLSPHTAGE